MKKAMLGLLAATSLLILTSPAIAGHVDWSVNIGVPAYYPPPVPVYYEPPPVVYAPAPVYVRPPPQVIYSEPAYYPSPYYYGYRRDHWRERGWREHEWREREWQRGYDR